MTSTTAGPVGDTICEHDSSSNYSHNPDMIPASLVKRRKPACFSRRVRVLGRLNSCLAPQVIAHMMPDLPNVRWERDIESFREFFENPAFRTDGLKVYPTLVIRGTGLYELWKARLYKNYEPVQLIDLVARILALVPPWVGPPPPLPDTLLPRLTQTGVLVHATWESATCRDHHDEDKLPCLDCQLIIDHQQLEHQC